MIASQAVRAAPARRVVQARPRHTARRSRASAPSSRADRTAWEIRAFVAVSAAIAFVFAMALLYLAQTTTLSAHGYEAQRLQQVRDELRRQNALLDVENARLESPARIEAEARKIGLVRAERILVVQLDPVTATRP